MSAYFCVRKGEQELVSFSRNSYVYQAFQLPYSEGWEELEREDFLEAISEIRLQKTGYEEGIRMLKKALEGLSYEEKLICLRDIEEKTNELKLVVQAKHYIELLQMIGEEYDENGEQQKMYYRIG